MKSLPWWPSPPPSVQPLQALHTLHECLLKGEAVPATVAALVAAALAAYLRGEAVSIVAALGLSARPGQRAAVSRERTARRNALLRCALAALSGPAAARAARLAELLHAPKLPDGASAALRELRRDHADALPRSTRHLQRLTADSQ